jgi:methionine-S-sulfoxide reductase
MAQERAVLAGGCFWGMQDLFRKLPGVASTRVGYTGGDLPHATYRNHGTHAEGIEILFDPERISYRRLLEFFFQIHDPTTPNRQGNDRGSSYRSAIYYVNAAQKQIALAPSPTSTPRVCGRARWLPKSKWPAISGKQSPSIRIISNTSPPATPATTRDRSGFSPHGKPPEP